MTLVAILGASFLISLAFPVFGLLLIVVGGSLVFVVIMAELIRAVGRSFGFRAVFEYKPPPLPGNVVRFPKKSQR